ncbi:unnamed protein product [Fusarium graminearum]|uniref:Uncharacterized protein n=1 Tax=Gibberella zeae TaxID=5518 RepID=A0A4E9E357_GIBZA|nr:unnamed protein product [Fusarium graminearum]CAF3495390.1 unnamed protein product [Fusarium graminearum]CAG1993523.1 unnamed protein product [Fusarium graminearum]
MAAMKLHRGVLRLSSATTAVGTRREPQSFITWFCVTARRLDVFDVDDTQTPVPERTRFHRQETTDLIRMYPYVRLRLFIGVGIRFKSQEEESQGLKEDGLCTADEVCPYCTA